MGWPRLFRCFVWQIVGVVSLAPFIVLWSGRESGHDGGCASGSWWCGFGTFFYPFRWVMLFFPLGSHSG
jgi:hypothetical protein